MMPRIATNVRQQAYLKSVICFDATEQVQNAQRKGKGKKREHSGRHEII